MPSRTPRSPRARAIALAQPAPAGSAAALGAAIVAALLALLAGFAVR